MTGEGHDVGPSYNPPKSECKPNTAEKWSFHSSKRCTRFINPISKIGDRAWLYPNTNSSVKHPYVRECVKNGNCQLTSDTECPSSGWFDPDFGGHNIGRNVYAYVQMKRPDCSKPSQWENECSSFCKAQIEKDYSRKGPARKICGVDASPDAIRKRTSKCAPSCQRAREQYCKSKPYFACKKNVNTLSSNCITEYCPNTRNTYASWKYFCYDNAEESGKHFHA